MQNNKRLIIILAAAGGLLLVPAVAMRFTDEVNWKPLAFIAMGFALLCTALAIEFALRTIKVTWGKVVAVVAGVFGFVMVWGSPGTVERLMHPYSGNLWLGQRICLERI